MSGNDILSEPDRSDEQTASAVDGPVQPAAWGQAALSACIRAIGLAQESLNAAASFYASRAGDAQEPLNWVWLRADQLRRELTTSVEIAQMFGEQQMSEWAWHQAQRVVARVLELKTAEQGNRLQPADVFFEDVDLSWYRPGSSTESPDLSLADRV